MNIFTSDSFICLAEHLLKDFWNIELIKQLFNEGSKKHDNEIEPLITGSCIEASEKR